MYSHQLCHPSLISAARVAISSGSSTIYKTSSRVSLRSTRSRDKRLLLSLRQVPLRPQSLLVHPRPYPRHLPRIWLQYPLQDLRRGTWRQPHIQQADTLLLPPELQFLLQTLVPLHLRHRHCLPNQQIDMLPLIRFRTV